MSDKLIIYKLNLPKEIIIKILKDHFLFVDCIDCGKPSSILTSKKCNDCNSWICKKHEKKALNWGKYYTISENYRMCDNCCWNYIT